MYEELITALRTCVDKEKGCDECTYYGKCMTTVGKHAAMMDAADAIEELSKRINRAVELYDRGVERSAMYEALKGISPEPPKEEA